MSRARDVNLVRVHRGFVRIWRAPVLTGQQALKQAQGKGARSSTSTNYRIARSGYGIAGDTFI